MVTLLGRKRGRDREKLRQRDPVRAHLRRQQTKRQGNARSRREVVKEKSFSVASNGYFVIDLYGECYIDFEYVVYYAPRVSGFLGYDSVSNLEGVQIRSYLIWYGVSYIKVDLPYSDFVYIQFG
ncbi:hypothetical protein ZIOFF_015568 [Zingiber officinale]|uniref:Uncharacterized protein n=1 Tax=Zingiber officinale TaxID=94328 RepID=A0A8J5HD62_ZINOF|nr:hypothetical protein ZIOFF_015568 [Zingiber officinale]